MSGGLDSYLAALSDRCRAADVPAVSPATGDFLAALVRSSGARRILEIGTAHGYSALRLADAAGEEGRVFTVEFSAPSYREALRNFAGSGIGRRIEASFGNALEFIATLPPGAVFDAAFVDGEKKRTVEFLSAVWPLVRPGGWVAVDDAVKFRWKMTGLDEWLERAGVVGELARTDPDDGVLLLRKPY